jgi:uncharacterized protein
VDVVVAMLGGAIAGCLGALLGIGGGVFLVPILNLIVHLSFRQSTAISLVTVIATSSVTSASAARLQLVNLRLGMVLEIFTTIGGFAGLLLVYAFSEHTLYVTFAVVMTVIAVVMVQKRDQRTSHPDPTIDVGRLGARYFDTDTGQDVAYRVRRVPLAFIVSFLAGVISTLAGIGGGVLKVPALNAWCGVPIRAAAATSALMIGATALVGALAYFVRGEIIPALAASAALGVLRVARWVCDF